MRGGFWRRKKGFNFVFEPSSTHQHLLLDYLLAAAVSHGSSSSRGGVPTGDGHSDVDDPSSRVRHRLERIPGRERSRSCRSASRCDERRERRLLLLLPPSAAPVAPALGVVQKGPVPALLLPLLRGRARELIIALLLLALVSVLVITRLLLPLLLPSISSSVSSSPAKPMLLLLVAEL